jgi:hypothetical protein
MARWTSANVLRTGRDAKRLWQFSLKGDRPQLIREETRLPAEPLPNRLISKDWQTLYQPRLNIAWLPADRVFLRVIQLPPSDTIEETISMLELQLEKLSPLPVAQIVWTFDLIAKQEGGTVTAVVVIAARNMVEEFLGKLEGQAYLADRLDVPFLDQLMVQRAEADGVWIYTGGGPDQETCLVAWWAGGLLHSVSLMHLPSAEEGADYLRDQLVQMAWAGELEGWLTGPMRRYLVATEEMAAIWRPLIETPEQPIEVIAPAPEAEVAAMTARRAAKDGARTSLVPPEFTARYRQQFVDRIWMRVVAATIILYLIGVVVYIGALQWAEYGVSKLEADARGLQGSYTNALKLKAQVQVMEEQLNLQFAALRCYKAVAEKLPEGLTVDSIAFSRGKTLQITGAGEQGTQATVTEFSDALRRYTIDGQPLFARVATPNIGPGRAGSALGFNFQCELKTFDTE